MKTVKRERQVRLDELLKYVWDNGINDIEFHSDNDSWVRIDDYGDLTKVYEVESTDLFTITEEFEVTEEMRMEIKIGDKITSKHTGVIREVTNIKDDLIFIGNTGMHITKDELKHFTTAYDEVEVAKYNTDRTNKDISNMKSVGLINTKDISDGYHTFGQLYHDRAILFAVICNMFKDKAWKSKQHDDGTMFDDMFIVGVETPQGRYTYHYHIEPYWDMYNVKEIEYAPMWDRHTHEDVNRLFGLLDK